MATLEELVVRIKADATQLEREMKRAGQVTQDASKKMGGALGGLKNQLKELLPALSAAAFVAFSKRAIAAAGHINDLATQIGFSVGTLTGLESALADTGASLEDFAMANSLLQNALGEAAKGGQEQIKVFDELGLSVRSLQRLTPEDQFYAVVEALAQVDEQYRQTEIGRSLFGRGFGKLQPLLKESKGDLRGVVEEQERLNKALGEETVGKLDAFGDAMGRVGLQIRNDFLTAFAQIAPEIQGLVAGLTQVPAAIRAAFVDIPFAAGQGIGNYLSGRGLTPSTPKVRQNLSGLQTDLNRQLEAAGLVPSRSPGARGSNAGLLKPEKTEAQKQADKEQNDRLQERARIIEQNRTAYEVMVDDSIRANDLLGDDQQQLNRELQRSWEEYVSSVDDGTEEAKEHVEELAVSIRESLANSFEAAIFDARNFGDAMSSIFDGIARQIARVAIIDPLSSSITESIKKSDMLTDLGKLLHFADGGRPPVGMPSLVGERGPELFVPDGSGTIVPNHALGGRGGQQIVVQNAFHINAGVQGTVRSELMSAIPSIVAMSKQAVIEGAQRGGAESQLFGRRN